MSALFSSLLARPALPQGLLPKSIPHSSPDDPTPFTELRESGELVGGAMRQDVVQASGDLGGFMSSSANSSEYTPLRNECWTPYALKPFMPVPAELSSQWAPNENVKFGLLPEINRAWWAWQNKLTLWDLINGEDTFVFEDQPYEISSIALVRPKPGVFLDTITYVLVLVSPSIITLHPLSLTPSAPSPDSRPCAVGITLFNFDIAVHTPGGEMRSVVGTQDGRVFMCGERDGCIYELLYRREEAWFGKKAWLENRTGGGYSAFVPTVLGGAKHDFVRDLAIDAPRSCLYAITSTEDISLYYLSAVRTSTASLPLSSTPPFTPIHTAKNIFSTSLSLSPSNPSLPSRAAFHLTSLHPTLPEESKSIHLVAVTSTGVRLYFSFHKRGAYSFWGVGGGAPNPQPTPQSLELMHVRSPPTIPSEAVIPRADPAWYGRPPAQTQTPAAAAAGKPQLFDLASVSATQLSASDFLLTQVIPGTSGVRHKDALLAIAPDLARLGGYNASSSPSSSHDPTIAPQPQQQQQQKPLLTETWAIFPIDGSTRAIAPLHPPTLLVPDLPGGGGTGNTLSSEVVLQFGTRAVGYTVLTTAGVVTVYRRRGVDVLKGLVERAGRTGMEEQVIQFWDVWGRDQASAMCLALACGNAYVDGGTDDGVRAGAARLFQRLGGMPARLRNLNQEDSVYYSGKHAGLVVYVARLLRPIWKVAVAKVANKKFETNVPGSVLVGVQTELSSLKMFMDREAMAFEMFVSPDPVDPTASARELASVRAVKALVARTIEAISFMQLVIDFNMNDIIAQCEPAMQQLIPRMTYEDLLVTEKGTEVARALVNAIINHQIARQRSVDAVSETLQERCGSFCNPEDVVLYKGLENIRNARAAQPQQRMAPLRESLRLFLQAARAIRPQKLAEYCKEYCELSYPPGAVGLPLRCAKEWDSFDEGAAWRLSNNSKDDPRYQKYQLREAAYACVIESLKYFDQKVLQQAATANDFTDAETLRKSAMSMALSSDDAIFHRHLYDWFIADGQSARLLELRTPFIEVYLADPPMSLFKSELLWQYYVRNDKPAEAAVVLENMAHVEDPSLSLEQRIEYLSRAVSNAKRLAAPVGDKSPVEFLTDLEERLEVAQLQAEIYVLLEGRYALDPATKQELLGKLSEKLYTITELYQYFALPYQLHYVKLLILHVSDHQDLNLVMGIWRDIINEAQNTIPPQNTIAHEIATCGRRLYPSNVAFPIDLLFPELLRYQWDHKPVVPHGWARDAFVAAGVEWRTVFDSLEALYRDQSSPPWSSPEGIRYLQTEIAVFLSDWFKSQSDPRGHRSSSTFPAEFVDAKVNAYMTQQTTEEGRRMLADLSREIRRTY